MAIRARVLRQFPKRRHAVAHHIFPGLQILDVAIAQSRLLERAPEVIAEKHEIRRVRLHCRRIFQHVLHQVLLRIARNRIREHGERVYLLCIAEFRRIPQQTALRVEVRRVRVAVEFRGELAVVRGFVVLSEMLEEFGAFLERERKQEPIRDGAPAIFDGPVSPHLDLLLPPSEHVADARQKLPRERVIAAVHPMVVHHGDPVERKRREKLLEVGGISALGQSGRYTRGIDVLDRKAHQPVVAREVEPGQRLHLGIGDVLHPLPGYVADEGLLGVERERAPGCVPDRLQLFGVAFKNGRAGCRIHAEEARRILDEERLGECLDVELHPAPIARPQRAVFACRSIGQEDVLRSHDVFAVELIPVSLCALAVVQSLRASEMNLCALAASNSQNRVAGGQCPLVQ